MKLIIEISEDDYRKVQDGRASVSMMRNAIKNGTALPKDHGRLKDIDAFIDKVNADRSHACYVRSWTADDVLDALNSTYAPTIIEADKAERGE